MPVELSGGVVVHVYLAYRKPLYLFLEFDCAGSRAFEIVGEHARYLIFARGFSEPAELLLEFAYSRGGFGEFTVALEKFFLEFAAVACVFFCLEFVAGGFLPVYLLGYRLAVGFALFVAFGKSAFAHSEQLRLYLRFYLRLYLCLHLHLRHCLRRLLRSSRRALLCASRVCPSVRRAKLGVVCLAFFGVG